MSQLKSEQFFVNGIFTVPMNVSSVFVTMVAGGGGGGPGNSGNTAAGGGGGAGEFCVRKEVKVSPADVISITIGSEGSGGTFNGTLGGNGTASTFGSLLSLQGGFGGLASSNIVGGTKVGAGGGSNGGALGAGDQSNTIGIQGGKETKSCFGGSSGGGKTGNFLAPLMYGGPCGPYPGGPPGSNTGSGSLAGAGGGSSMWGIGGAGGNGSSSGPGGYGDDGKQPLVGCYGAGGGGASGGLGTRIGGAGREGYCLVEWIA